MPNLQCKISLTSYYEDNQIREEGKGKRKANTQLRKLNISYMFTEAFENILFFYVTQVNFYYFAPFIFYRCLEQFMSMSYTDGCEKTK